jgi:hypothetical protein
MSVLVALITIGSFVTHVKNGWELSRLIRKKIIDSKAQEAQQRLQRAFDTNHISQCEYTRLRSKIDDANANNDCKPLEYPLTLPWQSDLYSFGSPGDL